MEHSQKVIGGQDYTLEELLTWHPVHLAGLILNYQATRKHWQRADAACGTLVALLRAELKANRRELDGARVELKLRRTAAKQRVARRAA